jgi:hypothetical protein
VKAGDKKKNNSVFVEARFLGEKHDFVHEGKRGLHFFIIHAPKTDILYLNLHPQFQHFKNRGDESIETLKNRKALWVTNVRI